MHTQFEKLTPRQAEYLYHRCAGLSQYETCQVMSIVNQTGRVHAQAVTAAFGYCDITSAVYLAYKTGWYPFGYLQHKEETMKNDSAYKLWDYLSRHPRATAKQAMQALGWRSKSTFSKYINRLAEWGVVTHDPKKGNARRVITPFFFADNTTVRVVKP